MLTGDEGIHPLAEGNKLIIGKNVRQALQRDLVRDRLELAQCLAADALCRGIRRDKLRICLLQRFEALQERIEAILPCHLAVTYHLIYLTWQELETFGLTWEILEQANMTWEELERYGGEV